MGVTPSTPLDKIAQNFGYRSADRYRKRCSFLFEGLKLDGARVLDIGCGKGSFAVWAGLHGASHVLGIEPEHDGSTEGTLAHFQKTIDDLNLGNVIDARASFLEGLKPSDGPFDVVVLFNVINHLDEEAVVSLHVSEQAVASYREILHQLRGLIADGGCVIVADCGRRNFWNDIGLRNPLVPSIEWSKHQQPEVWTSVFQDSGFMLRDLRWSSIYPLGILSRNWPIHYLTLSHFTLRFDAI